MFNGGALRKRLQQGETIVGTIMYFGVPAFVEVAAEMGFEWLFVDTEHGPVNLEAGLMPILLAAKGTPMDVIVRVPGLNEQAMKRALDLGATGVVIPLVKSAGEVAQAVQWVKYHPVGMRGYGPLRADRYSLGAKEYIKNANDITTLIAQIECVEAVQQIREILAVPGLDAVFMGLADLSQSLGVLGEENHPRVNECVDEVLRACLEMNVPFGTFVRTSEQCIHWAQRGARLLTISSDMELWVDGLHREMQTWASSSSGARAKLAPKPSGVY